MFHNANADRQTVLRSGTRTHSGDIKLLFMDVGANIGQTTRFAAKMLEALQRRHSAARTIVASYEPSTANYKELTKVATYWSRFQKHKIRIERDIQSIVSTGFQVPWNRVCHFIDAIRYPVIFHSE